jgi:FlaA1/EpsC-like NDP-sugar epimerase
VSAETTNDVDRQRRFRSRYRTQLVIGVHGLLVALALLAAFLAAYNFRFVVREGETKEAWFFGLYCPLLLLALPVKLIVFGVFRQYRGSWRYVGLRDLYSVISTSLVASFFLLTLYFVLENVWQNVFKTSLFNRSSVRLHESSVFLLDWAATIAFVSAARILVRFYYEDIQPRPVANPNRVLIVGAGDTGEAVAREVLRMRRERHECVGFLDDEVPHLHGQIHGVEIVGRTENIREVCERLEVQEVLIALPHASPKMIRSLVERCQGTGVLFRTIPAVTDVIEGRVQVSQIRDVDIADLLGREPVELDTDKIKDELRGQCVLVTGAGGSIGSEMCRQIAGFAPRRLIALERAENNLFQIDRELRARWPALDVVPCVADIGDEARLRRVLEREKPSIVFHAAAHKHVPMMEFNPGEAIKNNIGGTVTLANAAIRAGVEKMVLISTDKAVNPTSIMGCTKRVAEMYVQSAGRSEVTQFVTVRFGNVLGSSGSVVPIFKEQIANGGPVTVTHPEMKRYFMTIPEAAQLVLQAGAMGKGGEIYVLHMGEPVKIVELARDMITLSGLRPGTDIEITFAGIRPGEKLFEELSTEDEHIGDTTHPKIGIWKHRSDDPDVVAEAVDRLLSVADTGSAAELQAELARAVPEFTFLTKPDGAAGVAAASSPQTDASTRVPAS